MTAATKPEPGTSIVRADTGEVKDLAPFDMATFLTELRNPAHEAQQKALSAAYDAACESIIGPNDVQVEGQRTFKKKSAWRKLARYFSISTRVVRVTHDIIQPEGHFLATVTVEASAPWGQSAEAVGACCTDEATGRRIITVADAIATAETRATNRATSNLIAMGEVSAEEMSKGGNGAAPKGDADKLMPFGKHKGKRLGDMDVADLRSTVAWCKETRGADTKKFADLIAACERVIASRTTSLEDAADVEYPEALQDGPDDLPF